MNLFRWNKRRCSHVYNLKEQQEKSDEDLYSLYSSIAHVNHVTSQWSGEWGAVSAPPLSKKGSILVPNTIETRVSAVFWWRLHRSSWAVARNELSHAGVFQLFRKQRSLGRRHWTIWWTNLLNEAFYCTDSTDSVHRWEVFSLSLDGLVSRWTDSLGTLK